MNELELKQFIKEKLLSLSCDEFNNKYFPIVDKITITEIEFPLIHRCSFNEHNKLEELGIQTKDGKDWQVFINEDESIEIYPAGIQIIRTSVKEQTMVWFNNNEIGKPYKKPVNPVNVNKPCLHSIKDYLCYLPADHDDRHIAAIVCIDGNNIVVDKILESQIIKEK